MITDKIALVTGATSGMGKFIATDLACQGATVILVARSSDKGKAVQSEIRSATQNQNVDYLVADLSSQTAIRNLVEEFKQRYTELHILVNNAGAHFMQRELSIDNMEMNLAVNHLSVVLLCELLMDTLINSAPARIVNVASNSMTPTIQLEDLQSEKSFEGFKAYGQAKLAMTMYSYYLAKKLSGSGVTVNTLHPGIVGTDIIYDVAPTLVRPFVSLIKRFLLTPEEGSQTAIYLASSPAVEGITGHYFVRGKMKRSVEISYDLKLQNHITNMSKKLLGLPDDTLSIR